MLQPLHRLLHRRPAGFEGAQASVEGVQLGGFEGVQLGVGAGFEGAQALVEPAEPGHEGDGNGDAYRDDGDDDGDPFCRHVSFLCGRLGLDRPCRCVKFIDDEV